MKSVSAASRMRDFVLPACRPVVRTAMGVSWLPAVRPANKRFKCEFETGVFLRIRRMTMAIKAVRGLTPLEDPTKAGLVRDARRGGARGNKKAVPIVIGTASWGLLLQSDCFR